jgi:hypothetical protein
MGTWFRILILASTTLGALTAHADVCLKWFERAKLDPKSSSCVSDCVSVDVSMGTFSCPTQCASFCKRPLHKDFIFKVSELYGLTLAERALVAQMPELSWKAYRLSHQAEELCQKMYSSSLTNDASDACRHFLWAALMTRDLGSQVTSQFLEAHEEDSKQPAGERAMDLANNRLGALVAIELMKKTKRFSDESIFSEFENALKSKKLVILKERAEVK